MSGKCLSVLFLLCALLLTIPGGAVPLSYRVGLGDDPEVPRILREFTDVSPEAWYGESLAFVCQRGLFQGTSATTFSPLQPMTRAMGAEVLWRHAGAPEQALSLPSSEVLSSAWYASAVSWAWESGILCGDRAGTCAPEAPLTREMLVTLLWRYAGQPAPSAALAGFADQADVSAWALDAVTWAVELALLTGDTPLTLSPGRAVTRAEAAVLLTRFCQQVIA